MQAIRPITDYMTPKSRLVTFSAEQSILEAINSLKKYKISGAPVLDEMGKIIGMISEKDCLKVIVDSLYHDLMPGKVEQYMSKGVTTINENKNVEEVAELFINTNYKRFPVLNSDGELIGQISRADVLKAIEDIKFTHW